MTGFKSPGPASRTAALVCLSVALSSVLYYKLAFVSARRELAELQQRIASEQGEVEKLQSQVAALSTRAPAALGASAELGEALDAGGSSEGFSSGFAEVIDTLARGDGRSPFALNKIVTEKQDNVNGFTRNLVEIAVEASFPAIAGFLAGLERSPLLTEVQSVEISRFGNELKRCSASIRLLSYQVKR